MTWLRTAIVMIAIALGFGSQSLSGQAPGEIALVGSFIGDGPWARSSGRWLTLVERDGGFDLREVVVSSTQEKLVCGDVGFTVHAADANPDTLLLRGFSAVRAGPVVAAFHGDKFLLPGEWLDLPLGGDASWSLHAFGTVRPAVGSGLGEAQFTDYQVHMTGRGRTAVVFSLDRLDNNGPPKILWAGDLDGDRVADLFADIRTHYAGHHYVLFLSSLAREGQLVAEAASLTTGGC